MRGKSRLRSESPPSVALRSKMRDFRMAQQRGYLEQAAARTLAAINSREPFRERLVHFWSNHFTVSMLGKPLLSSVAVSFENEAIRPYVTGRFVDLLLAVETHPAMLIYLDNQSSIGPHSRAARRARGRKRGLNENLAREILELHTLGVTGGYTQQDVTTFAEVITGWSVGREGRRFSTGRAGRFAFLAPAHEPGRKTLLGRSYPDTGFEQGVSVLRDLAAHPATAARSQPSWCDTSWPTILRSLRSSASRAFFDRQRAISRGSRPRLWRARKPGSSPPPSSRAPRSSWSRPIAPPVPRFRASAS